MTTLQQALASLPYHLIAIIGRTHGLRLSANLSKAELAPLVATALLEPGTALRALARLPAEARQSLSYLIATGGRTPARYLTRQFGGLRPARQLIQAHRGQADLATLETLCVLGLAFQDPQTGDLFIPSDLLPLLPSPQVPPPPPPATLPGPEPVDLTGHDLTGLLALLQRRAVIPLHGRWLPPRFLTEWGHLCAVPPATLHPRSERQTGRRRFLHYLAENAGFLNDELRMKNDESRTPPSPLTLSPAAWLWLKAPRQERRQILWTAWSQPDLDRWRAYRLPGSDWLAGPERLLGTVHSGLLEVDPGDPAGFAARLLRRQPDLLDLVPAGWLEPATLLVDTIAVILVGPLVWLGVLADGEGEGEGATRYRITAQGYAWLTGQPVATEPTPSAKFNIDSTLDPDPLRSHLTLALSHGRPEPADLMVALEVSDDRDRDRDREVKGETGQTTLYHYRITAVSFIRALHRGWSPPALMEALNRLAERPLTGQELTLLRGWAQAAGRMTLQQATLLETTDPDLITRLAATRRGRSLIHRTLSPRAVIVDPTRLDLLIRRLTEQEGIPPRIAISDSDRDRDRDTDTNSPNSKNSPNSSHSPHSKNSLNSADAAHLWQLTRIYQDLGRYISLPTRLPQTLIDKLTALAQPADLAAAEVAAEQTLAGLRDALDGRVAFPVWSDDGVPLTQSLPLIEQALQTGQNLDLLYYAAGTDRLTRRVVEPYRLEQRGDTVYLVAFCHHAQAERTFRLDRIRAIEIERGEGDKEGNV